MIHIVVGCPTSVCLVDRVNHYIDCISSLVLTCSSFLPLSFKRSKNTIITSLDGTNEKIEVRLDLDKKIVPELPIINH